MLPMGRMNKRVALQKATTTATTAGQPQNWTTYVDDVPAAVEPAAPGVVERLIGPTVETPVTHLVTIWYRERRASEDDPGPTGKISVADRVLYESRALHIGQIADLREAHRQLILACEERLE